MCWTIFIDGRGNIVHRPLFAIDIAYVLADFAKKKELSDTKTTEYFFLLQPNSQLISEKKFHLLRNWNLVTLTKSFFAYTIYWSSDDYRENSTLRNQSCIVPWLTTSYVSLKCILWLGDAHDSSQPHCINSRLREMKSLRSLNSEIFYILLRATLRTLWGN